NQRTTGDSIHQTDDALTPEQPLAPVPNDDDDNDEAAARFARYVAAAVDSLPAEFRRRIPNVIVRVADEPDAETLRKMCVSNGQTLFGLYEGTPLTMQGARGVNPEVITIYRRPIERSCGGDQARLRRQIRKTIYHEVAHHFGIDHDAMPAWVR
ncbi:MAG TPA: metallopeptidase family protein, partial [Ktedonobacterales bacterium]|nr:metallopeptidase family protein [Ktedonobacterales bacterium]